MMNKKKSNEILTILKQIIENPKPELRFSNLYELIISVVLSAQTTDKRVNEVTLILFNKYHNFNELMNADLNDVINIIKPIGFANNKAKNIILLANKVINDYNGILPNSIEELIKLPGVGRKTASVVLALGFNIPAFPVDTHLIRMSHIFGYSNSNDPYEIEMDYKKYIDRNDWILAHHLFLLFGRYTCKAQNPSCDNCKLIKYCKRH